MRIIIFSHESKNIVKHGKGWDANTFGNTSNKLNLLRVCIVCKQALV